MENTNKKLTAPLVLKKAFAVLMAVVMVMSAWVFTEPLKAEAASGSYYVRVSYECPDGASDGVGGNSPPYTGPTHNSRGQGFTIWYSKNNGTDTEENYSSNSWKDMSSETKQSFTGTRTVTVGPMEGFPVRLQYYNLNVMFDGCVWFVTGIEVASSNSSNASWTPIWSGKVGAQANSNTWKADITASGVGALLSGDGGWKAMEDDKEDNWIYPYAKDITWSPESLNNMTSPKNPGDPAATQGGISVTAKDQYGVQMFDPTGYTVTSTNDSTKNGFLTATPDSGASTTINVTYGAVLGKPGTGVADHTLNCQLTATWKTPNSIGHTEESGSIPFDVIDPQYTATFTGAKNSDGSDVADKTVNNIYYGTDVSGYAPDTAQSYRAGDNDYTFTGWTPDPATGITADTTYTATYSHEFVPADYTKVDAAKAEAEKYTGWDYYREAYSEASRTALEAAVNGVVPDLGISQQETVNGFATAINDAIANLQFATYTVTYLNEDGSVVEVKEYSFKDIIEERSHDDVSKAPDDENHYEFADWSYDSNVRSFEETTAPDGTQIAAGLHATANAYVTATYNSEGHQYGNRIEIEATCTHGAGYEQVCDDCQYEDITSTSAPDPNAHPADKLYYAVVKDADCTNKGAKQQYCAACDKKVGAEVSTPELGHSYSAKVTAPASCTEEGTRTFTCARGDHSYTEPIPRTQHEYEVKGTEPATCTTSGYTVMKCKNCTSTYNEYDSSKPAKGHKYDNWTISATGHVTGKCQNEGCTDPDIEFDVTLPSNHEHDFQNGTVKVIKQPTCIKKGEVEITCKDNDSAKVTVELDTNPDAHTNLKTNFTQATCTGKGSISFTCEDCNRPVGKETEVDPLGHSYDYDRVDPTCKKAGSIKRTCSRCGDVQTETIAQLNHKTVTVVTDCTKGGYIKCVLCDETITTVSAKEHKLSAWETFVSATCISQGVESAECSECGKMVIRKTDPAAHQYDGTYTVDAEATCTAPGSESHHCTVCGYSDTTTSRGIEQLGHAFEVKENRLPSCTDTGRYYAKCIRCEEEIDQSFGTTIPHNYTEVVRTQEATCANSGYTEYRCSVCHTGSRKVYGGDATKAHTWNITNTHYDATLGKTVVSGECSVCNTTFSGSIDHVHDNLEYVETTKETCQANGSVTLKCNDCGENFDITIPKNENAHELKTKVNKATCTKKGSVVYECVHGDYTSDPVETIPELGHDYKVEEKPATCSSAGLRTYTCTRTDCDKGTDWTKTETIEIDSDAHSFVKKGDLVAAGCVTPAYQEYECEHCHSADVSYRVYTGDAKGHSYTITVTQEGSKVIVTGKCNCGATIEKFEQDIETEIVGEGHNFSVVREGGVTPATCIKEGSVTVYCDAEHNEDCEESIKVDLPIDKTAHKLKTEQQAPSCHADGWVKTYCELCNGKETVTETSLKFIDHEYEKLFASLDATCLTDGYKVYQCKNCTAIGNFQTIAASDEYHGWEEVTVDVTCTKDGYTVTRCKYCGEEQGDRVETKAQGHKYNDEEEPKVVSKATCTQPQILEKECTVCGTTNQIIDKMHPALGHEYEGKYTTDVNPTCTEAGTMSRHCVRYGKDGCESKIDVKPVNKIDHAMSEWVTTKPSTCSEEGTQVRNCLYKCGLKEERTLSKLSHTWSELLVQDWPATCTEVGQLSIHCLECGEIKPGSIVKTPMTPHTYKDEDVETKVKPTCTTGGIKQVICQECKQTVTLETQALGHDFDMSKIIYQGIAKDKTYTWDTFGCTRCGDAKCVIPTIIARDEHGTPIEGATVILRDMNGSVISSGKTDASGEFRSTAVLSDCDFAVYVRDDVTYSEGNGKLTVKDGMITGSFGAVDGSGNLGKGTCGNCSCHGTGFFARIKRWFYTFFSVLFNRTIKCCDDMEWYGSWASRLK